MLNGSQLFAEPCSAPFVGLQLLVHFLLQVLRIGNFMNSHDEAQDRIQLVLVSLKMLPILNVLRVAFLRSQLPIFVVGVYWTGFCFDPEDVDLIRPPFDRRYESRVQKPKHEKIQNAGAEFN